MTKYSFRFPHARELLEVIEDRMQIRATLITSQLPVDHLHTAIVDPTVADAILDRLATHTNSVSKASRCARCQPHSSQTMESRKSRAVADAPRAGRNPLARVDDFKLEIDGRITPKSLDEFIGIRT
jgi:hypothetical protein